jgi:hypothetical protein
VAPQESALPICPACNRPVPLESAKTDDKGRAIHEECYVHLVVPSTGNQFPSPN